MSFSSESFGWCVAASICVWRNINLRRSARFKRMCEFAFLVAVEISSFGESKNDVLRLLLTASTIAWACTRRRIEEAQKWFIRRSDVVVVSFVHVFCLLLMQKMCRSTFCVQEIANDAKHSIVRFVRWRCVLRPDIPIKTTKQIVSQMTTMTTMRCFVSHSVLIALRNAICRLSNCRRAQLKWIFVLHFVSEGKNQPKCN